MTELNLKKTPHLPDDAEAYRKLDSGDRLAVRVKLAARSRPNLPLYLSAVTFPLSLVVLAASVFGMPMP
ncbi:MAG: hypothetical protein QM607_00160, partial [Microbacterium sp.]